MVIYPEGLTSSCEKVNKFQRGSFQLKYPLKIEGLKYKGTIENSVCMMTIIEGFMAICLNFKNSFTHQELDSLIEPACEMTWEEYAEEVRTLMCQEFGYTKGNGNFMDKRNLYTQLTGKKLSE